MRININMSDEMNREFTKLGEEYGMSKSGVMSFVLGQWLKEQRQVKLNQEFFIDKMMEERDKK